MKKETRPPPDRQSQPACLTVGDVTVVLPHVQYVGPILKSNDVFDTRLFGPNVPTDIHFFEIKTLARRSIRFIDPDRFRAMTARAALLKALNAYYDRDDRHEEALQ